MTAMLASVTGPAEAETAIAGGADIIDLKDPAAGALGALPAERVAATVAAIAGRRPASAVAGAEDLSPDALAAAVDAAAATGVAYVKVGLYGAEERQRATIAALSASARRTRLVAVLFADHFADGKRDPAALIPALTEAGFAGVMLDTADKARGRLLVHIDVTRLAGFVQSARGHGLIVGLAGGLESPDVPRLITLSPDFLGFRGALCAAGRRADGLDPADIAAIRALIPPERPAAAGSVDYSLLSARGYHPETSDPTQVARIFVRDLVLPVRIGAYSHEHAAPQKVRFDVSVDVRRTPGRAHAMSQVFSYDLITDAIARIVAAEHIDFVETLAERVGTAVLADPRAGRVTVKVEKLEIGPGGVGVELTMERPEQASEANPVLAMMRRSEPETR